MVKSFRDSLLKEKKESIVAMYRAKDNELGWYERLETLRARRVSPFVVESVKLDDFESGYPGEYLSAHVYAPCAADGGVIRVVWTRYDDPERSDKELDLCVRVAGWEAFKGAGGGPATRALIERLGVAIARLFHPEEMEAARRLDSARASSALRRGRVALCPVCQDSACETKSSDCGRGVIINA